MKTTSKIPKDDMLVTFLTCIGQDLYEVIKDIFAPQILKDLTYSSFKVKMSEHVAAKTNVIVERFRFHAMRQSEFQSSQYFIVKIQRTNHAWCISRQIK